MKITVTDNIREKIVDGIEKVVNIVRTTMGPKGRNVVLDNGNSPIFTNDGVTVAKHIQLEDKIENIGASLIKEACEKTNREGGDGTTSTAVLTYAIAKEGLRYIKEGMNPFMLSKALYSVSQDIIDIVRTFSRGVTTKQEIQQVATISAQDEEVGQLIADVMEATGHDCTITVEEGKTTGITHEIKTGMQFDQGYVSPYYINRENQECHINNPAVLVADMIINNFKQLKPLIEKLLKEQKDQLLIICNDIEPDALASVLLNKINGVFNAVVIKSPGFGDQRSEMLKDIATVTGATLVTEELGMKLEETQPEQLGSATKIVATEKTTMIVDGAGTKASIDERAKTLKGILNNQSGYEREKTQQRLSKLVGGIGVIRVGASTEMELKNKKYKIEDALNATRSAIEEGIVVGGGIALARASMRYEEEYDKIARSILKKAIKYPAQQIIKNAGYCPDKILTNLPTGHGFDAKTGNYVDMIETGIIDPMKVIRLSIENAVSSATMVLTTEAGVIDQPEPK